MDLRTYLNEAPRGAGVLVARAVGVHAVMVSQWAAGAKPIPDDRAPALEAATDFKVQCEISCPDARWVRVPAAGWPNGKPLLDHAPTLESTEQAG
jgi:hypothetical protein